MKTKTEVLFPTILTGLGVIGVVATTLLAIEATPKALKAREESKLSDALKYYIPTTIAATGTILCIIGANKLNKEQIAAITGTCAIVSKSYKKNKKKVKEIIETIQAHKNDISPVNSKGNEENEDEEFLIYDAICETYYYLSIKNLLRAEYEFNSKLVNENTVILKNFYDILGIEPETKNEEICSPINFEECGLVNFVHTKVEIDDGPDQGIDCYILDIS